jgi:hypothetical protein
MADTNGGSFEQWRSLAAAALTAVGGTGALVGLARLLDRVFPSADKRLEDAKDRRKERRDELESVKEERDEFHDKWIDAEERLIIVRREMMQRDAQLELLRTNLKLEKGMTPDQIKAAEAAMKSEQEGVE